MSLESGALNHYQGRSTVERRERRGSHIEECEMSAMILRQETQLAIIIGKTEAIYNKELRQSICKNNDETLDINHRDN